MDYQHGQVTFYDPGTDFPAISVTGRVCELGCDHCRGHYLGGMKAASSPKQLEVLALELSQKGAKGFLLSGGCDASGRIPLLPYVDAIRSIKSSTDLKVNLHTGLLDGQEARALVRGGADCYSMDMVQDEQVIREVLHLDHGKQVYEETLKALFSAGAGHLVPHICIGLAGSSDGERSCIDLVSKYPIDALVLLGFRPTPGTPWSARAAPSAERILAVLRYAVEELRRPVLIGCMRERGDWRLEQACLKAGAAGIACPSRRTVEWARFVGYRIELRKQCCALHR